MTDYWTSKLFYDLLKPAVAAEWKANQLAVIDRYPLSPAMRKAVIDDDIAVISANVNAYLLRFYYGVRGVKDEEFIRRLRELPERTPTHG